mgnify:CR=1 FL=1
MAHLVLKKSPGWNNKLKYTQENIGAKAEPPTRFYIFSCDCGVCNLSCHDRLLNSKKVTRVSLYLTSIVISHTPHILIATGECVPR